MRHNGADITVGCMPDIKGPGPQARVPFARPRAEEQRESGSARCRDYDASKKRNAVSRRAEKTAPVWPCEPLCGADGAGRHPRAHKNPLTALVEAVWRKAGTAARTRFHPKTESEPTDWKYSRRKNRRFCGAGSLTTARGAGSCGILKGRCSAHEIVALTLFSVEFGCLLRVAKSCWGVPGLFGHECPPQELRY